MESVVCFKLSWFLNAPGLIHGGAYYRNFRYFRQINPAVFLKILLHLLQMKLEPVVTLQFYSFQFHVFFFSCLIETKSECF